MRSYGFHDNKLPRRQDGGGGALKVPNAVLRFTEKAVTGLKKKLNIVDINQLHYILFLNTG